MKKHFLNLALILCMLILSGCSSRKSYGDDMTKYTDGYCWVNLLDESSYYQNGNKIASVLKEFLENPKDNRFYKVKLNEKVFGTDYYSQTVDEWRNQYYYGDLKSGKPDGYGLLVDGEGNIDYIGEFEKGKIQGYGVYLEGLTDECLYIRYEGNSKKSSGKIVYADGRAVVPYESFDIERAYENRPRDIDENGEYISQSFQWDIGEEYEKLGGGCWVVRLTPQYIGDIKKNEWRGNGIEYFPDGSVKYEGEFKNSRYHGKGILYYENGKIQYEGEFKRGSYHGKGTLYYENGEVQYKGKFKDGDAI